RTPLRRLRGHRTMISIAILYARSYRMMMLTNSTDIRPLHRTAVLHSIGIVNAAARDDFGRPTPCGDWTLLDLLAHMTVQHRGFAAAARGAGADLEKWNVDVVVHAVRADHARAYADAAHN